MKAGPDYQVPPQALAVQPAAASAFDGAVASGPSVASAQAVPAHWWRLFQDPTLDALIAQALERNTDLRQAAANLERVAAIEAETDAAHRPVLSANASAVRGHPSGLSLLHPGYVPPTDWYTSAGLSASYQLDLFGQLQRASEAAEAGTAAAQAALDLVRVSVAGNTARAYAQACSAGLRLAAARRSIAIQQQSLDVVRQLQRAGRAGAIEAGRAESQLELLQASVPSLQAQRRGAVLQLEALTGALPGAAGNVLAEQALACEAPPTLATLLPVGDGASLIRRRPDIREAERALAAATARIGVATADLYPKIAIGLSASTVGPASHFGNGDAVSFGLGPLISWTLPNTGAVRARIAQADAASRGAFARFDATVLAALRESETALDTYARDLERKAALEAAQASAARVAAQARSLYRAGKSGYLEELDAERSLAAVDAQVADAKAQVADDQVRVFMALGGGWQVSEDSLAAANRK